MVGSTVAVAQLVESQIVILVVVGSSPISHPTPPLHSLRPPPAAAKVGYPTSVTGKLDNCTTFVETEPSAALTPAGSRDDCVAAVLFGTSGDLVGDLPDAHVVQRRPPFLTGWGWW
jgi:hypothetical protein